MFQSWNIRGCRLKSAGPLPTLNCQFYCTCPSIFLMVQNMQTTFEIIRIVDINTYVTCMPMLCNAFCMFLTIMDHSETVRLSCELNVVIGTLQPPMLELYEPLQPVPFVQLSLQPPMPQICEFYNQLICLMKALYGSCNSTWSTYMDGGILYLLWCMWPPSQ